MTRILVWCTSAIGVVLLGMLTTIKTSALSAWQRSIGASPFTWDDSHQLEQANEIQLVLYKLDALLATPTPPSKVHLIVLVHGFLGNSMELDYLKSALEREADVVSGSSTMTATPQQQDIDEVGLSKACDSDVSSTLLVYRAHANTGRTFDGVEKGGVRLAKEVNTVLEQITERLSGKSTLGDAAKSQLTLSFVGHSLGGLYSRYSLSEIDWKLKKRSNSDIDASKTANLDTLESSIIDEQMSFEVEPKVFCSTASPHLGLHQQVSIPVPRFLEKTVGYTLQQTGQDLFRMSSLLNRMAMDHKFLEPLAGFETRLAYANAYGTDFQVPSVTAAFVTDDDDSIHTLLGKRDEDEDFVALRAQTPRKYSALNHDPNTKPQSEHDQLLEDASEVPNSILARHLDSLGWTKVWIDVREWIPSYRTSSDHEVLSSEALLRSKEVTSRELFQSPLNRLNDLSRTFPMGHTIMVANSKSEWYATLNAGGRPVMDRVAKDLIHAIFNTIL
jgi:hypothetical protein